MQGIERTKCARYKSPPRPEPPAAPDGDSGRFSLNFGLGASCFLNAEAGNAHGLSMYVGPLWHVLLVMLNMGDDVPGGSRAVTAWRSL